MRNEKFSYLIRVVAGIYLIYLAKKLITSLMNGELTGSGQVGIALGAVLFIVAGGFFAISGVRGSIRLVKSAKEQEAEEAKTEEATEAAGQKAIEEAAEAEDAESEEAAEAESAESEEPAEAESAESEEPAEAENEEEEKA